MNTPYSSQAKISFAVIGSAWRAEFFFRVAKALPERFEVCGIVTRSEEKGKSLEREWGIPTFRTVADLLKHTAPAFVVVCVPASAAPGFIAELAENGVPVLTETPPADHPEALNRLNKLVFQGAKIQVAEQLHLQPMRFAQLAVANSGKLGEIHETQISICHGYHAVSLLRLFLNVGFRNCIVRAREFRSPVVEGPGRAGGPLREHVIQSCQTLAELDFGDKLGLYDFDGEQYFSWIRSTGLWVRGVKGQIKDANVKYLKDYRTPIDCDLKRLNAGEDGNLEGYYLKGILLGEDWIYRNPYAPARLTDDEIAVASALDRMSGFLSGGSELYSLADASQDYYLSTVIQRAVETGEAVPTQSQVWAV